MKDIDIVAIGESVIDMTPAVGVENDGMLFEASPGGAPCNVLAMAAKLGARCAFIGKIGADAFGDMLVATLERLGIETSGVRREKNALTPLAVVAFDRWNDRSFSFYKNDAADLLLRCDEIDVNLVERSKIVHFGTTSLSGGESRAATMYTVDVAKAAGSIVSFDPNIRANLWENEEELRKMTKYGVENCRLLKLSAEEATFISGLSDAEKAVEQILSWYPNISAVFLTLGAEGCIVFSQGKTIYSAGIAQDTVQDTTGAGDAFFGVCLYYAAELGLSGLSADRLAEIAKMANAAGSIVVGRRGSMCVMPSAEEIGEILRKTNGDHL